MTTSRPELEAFLDHLRLERALSPNTCDSYRRDLEDFISFLASRGREAITANLDDARHYAGDMRRRGLKNSSAARRISALRGFYNFLNMAAIIPDNPMELLAAPSSERQFIMYEALRKGATVDQLYAKTFGNLMTKIPGTARALGLRLILDPLNLLGVGEVRNAIKYPLKALKPIGTAIKEAPLVEKAVQFARTTPAIYRPLEATISPYFRNPEAGKVIEASRTALRGKINNLIRMTEKAQKSLTPAEQARVAQLLEGSVTTAKTDPKLIAIAEQFRPMAEDIGQASVDLGLMSKEAFEKYRGKYMPHAVWQTLTEPGMNPYAKTSAVPKISGQFFKQRKGAEGYVQSFAPNVLKGLGTELSDIEAARMYQNIGKQFGVNAPKTITPTNLAQDLLNTLLKDKKVPIKGLGQTGPGYLTPSNIGSELLDYFTKHQPAQNLAGMGADVRGIAGKTSGGWERVRKLLIGEKAPTAAELGSEAAAAGNPSGPVYQSGSLWRCGSQRHCLPGSLSEPCSHPDHRICPPAVRAFPAARECLW